MSLSLQSKENFFKTDIEKFPSFPRLRNPERNLYQFLPMSSSLPALLTLDFPPSESFSSDEPSSEPSSSLIIKSSLVCCCDDGKLTTFTAGGECSGFLNAVGDECSAGFLNFLLISLTYCKFFSFSSSPLLKFQRQHRFNTKYSMYYLLNICLFFAYLTCFN